MTGGPIVAAIPAIPRRLLNELPRDSNSALRVEVLARG